jgi:hypothetical protein
MLRDFATVLSDPEYVKWQVSGGLRPRADVQRAVNAAAASADAAAAGAAFQASLSARAEMARENSVDGREQRERDEDLAPDELREGNFSTIPGVAGVVRAMLDPKRSARRAYEYVHGVGWVLEMYYGGACLDYGYHFQYSSKEHNAGIAATIGVDGAGGKNENGASRLARAADDAATAAATAAVAAAAAAAASGGETKTSADSKHSKNGGPGAFVAPAKPPHMGGRNTIPPPAVDLADFQTLPDTYDPRLDPLRDRNRAAIAYLNRYPITPLAYSLAVIPRGGRAVLARGVRPLVDAGSPVHHLFCDDYCVTCIKHRITAGPLERVIQQESAGRAPAAAASGRAGAGAEGGGGGAAATRVARRLPRARDLSRKFAGGDATIREAAAAGGDVAREVLKKLNRRHLEHLSRAPQHAQDKPPPPLNDLEGAVARVSLDDGLNEDEETLRTLGDQPVLIWHHTSCDPPEVDLTLNDALTLAEDIPRWAARVTPAGCRPVGGQMHEIRRYDGDAEPVIARWAVGGEAPPGGRRAGRRREANEKGRQGQQGRGGQGRRQGRREAGRREPGQGEAEAGPREGNRRQGKRRAYEGRGDCRRRREQKRRENGGDEIGGGARRGAAEGAVPQGAVHPRAERLDAECHPARSHRDERQPGVPGVPGVRRVPRRRSRERVTVRSPADFPLRRRRRRRAPAEVRRRARGRVASAPGKLGRAPRRGRGGGARRSVRVPLTREREELVLLKVLRMIINA